MACAASTEGGSLGVHHIKEQAMQTRASVGHCNRTVPGIETCNKHLLHQAFAQQRTFNTKFHQPATLCQQSSP